MPRLTHLAGLELSTEREPQHRRAGGRRGGCCARPSEPDGSGRLVLRGAMAPEERFLPRFAAEPPQEELPYGRWEERLAQEFLAAALALDAERGGPRRARRDRVVSRPHLARAHLRAGDLATASGYELFGYVRFVPAREDGEPSDFSAHVDFTEETAERNPDWQLDLCEEVIGSWRGAVRRGRLDDARVGTAAGLRRARS